MRRLLLAAVLLLLPISSLAETVSLKKSGQAKVGAEAPWFSGWTPDNLVLNRTRVTERPGRAHLLLFFATWCKPCEAGLSALVQRREDLRSAGVDVVLVAYKEEAEKVAPWLAERGLGGEALLLDRFGQVARAFGAETGKAGKERSALPRSALLDGGGIVRALYSKEGDDFVDTIVAAAARLRPVAAK